MPIYEYVCPRCDRFEASRPLDAAGEAIDCPVCGSSAARYYGPPNIVRTPAALAWAKERSERSAYEPEVVTTAPRGRPLPRRHAPSPPWTVGH